MRLIENRKTISTQLAELVTVSLCISVILFSIIHIIGNQVVYRYLDKSDYVNKKNEFYSEKLQKYVNHNNIKVTEAEILDRWVKKQEILWLEIYDDKKWIYTSNHPFEGKTANTDYPDGWKSYLMTFADGQFEVGFYGNYTYKFFYYSLTLELLICFAVFFGIVMCGIRKMIVCVQTLKDEINILEGGNLEYKVSVKGNNEIMELANSVECLRKSILSQFKKEEELKSLNNKIITELSHDIRTPLTTIMIYQAAIEHKKYRNEDQLLQYIKKIGDQLEHMNYLIDAVFEYSVDRMQDDDEVIFKGSFKNTFYEVILGFKQILAESNFNVLDEIKWYTGNVCVYSEDINRIINNILSNILKYADKKSPVRIRSLHEGECKGFVFENEILHMDDDKKAKISNHIGIANIKAMMEKNGGHCSICRKNNKFSIAVLFRTEKKI